MTVESQVLANTYNAWVISLRKVIKDLARMRQLGLLETVQAQLLRGMRLYEDICSTKMTPGERKLRFEAMKGEVKAHMVELSRSRYDEPYLSSAKAFETQDIPPFQDPELYGQGGAY